MLHSIMCDTHRLVYSYAGGVCVSSLRCGRLSRVYLVLKLIVFL